MAMALRIGLVTDIHHGPDKDVRTGTAARPLLAAFTTRMREQFRPDLIVDLGDRINDVDPAADRARLREVRDMLEAAGPPIVYAWGNHDLANVPPADARAILGKKADHESFDANGYHLVVLNSLDPTVERIGGTLSPAQLDWLERDLRETSRPTIVFCHHPLDEQDPGRHWYFADHPDHALAGNRERARRVLAASGRVRAVFNGHMHLNTVEVIDGIPYITVMSLVDSKMTNGPSGCFAEIVLTDAGAVEVRLRGQLPMAVAFR
jgi:3',5'-cyclic AMP phosphodiesterase CpdA